MPDSLLSFLCHCPSLSLSLSRLVMYLINDGLVVVLMESVCGRINPFGRRLSSVFCPPRCMKGASNALFSLVRPLFFYWPLVVWFNCSCLCRSVGCTQRPDVAWLAVWLKNKFKSTNASSCVLVVALGDVLQAKSNEISRLECLLNLYTPKGAVWS